jgi:hypothetical protein
MLDNCASQAAEQMYVYVTTADSQVLNEVGTTSRSQAPSNGSKVLSGQRENGLIN